MSKHKSAGRIRIVGGKWRGRRLRVLDLPGLRPSTDRARETLFNWLAPQLEGARCLDLFAGCGALGLEALSRGAASVTLVEKNKQAAELLRMQATNMAANAFIEQADALVFLRQSSGERFDIVFLDPPYGSGLVEASGGLLEQYGWLNPNAYIYVETSLDEGVAVCPEGWIGDRQGRCGGSAMRLLRKVD